MVIRWPTLHRSHFLLVFFFLFNGAELLNIDLSNAVRYAGDEGSMFGFSVALFRQSNQSQIVVGAPKTKDSYFLKLNKSYEGGSLYFCDITGRDNDCRNLNFTRKFTSKEEVTEQWLGATLAIFSQSKESGLVVCAPNYLYLESENRTPTGNCYYLHDKIQINEFSPLRGHVEGLNSGVKSVGYSQVGFSVAISKDTNYLYFGAVGSFSWEGQIFSIDKNRAKKNDWKKPGVGFHFTQRTRTNTTDELDSLYLGFSMTTLDLSFSDTNISGVAAAQPRENKLKGSVVIYTSNLTVIKKFAGEQMASYFGYSVCSVDVDGDQLDDLIIGAPMFSNYGNSFHDSYETGRVYVYYQGNVACSKLDHECGEMKFNKSHFIDGEHSKSRFGLAVASLGDINLDGFGDFAVGAPYEKLSELSGGVSSCTGALYIYHGSAKGVVKEYSQVVRASDVYQTNKALSSLHTFGFSISGGLDLDGNLYPDLVVGAYESDVAYFFRSRPIIHLAVNFSFVLENKIIALDKQNCALRNGDKVPCATLQMCLKYNGIGVPDKFEISLEIALDIKKFNDSRMFFLDEEMKNYVEERYIFKRDEEKCLKWEIYILLTSRLYRKSDKLAELVAQIMYNPVNTTEINSSVFDSKTPGILNDTVLIEKNCKKFVPDLNLIITSNNTQYVANTDSLLYLDMVVVNEGDDSFDTNFTLILPKDVFFSRFKSANDRVTSCTGNFTVVCHILEIPKGQKVTFNVVLDPKRKTNASEFEFKFQVETENAISNNKTYRHTIPIVEDSNLMIKNSSFPPYLNYTVSHDEFDIKTDVQAGPHVKHEYIIWNVGPSTASNVTMEFYWPEKLCNGLDLLYLIDRIVTTGPIECDEIYVNYKHLNLLRNHTPSQHDSSTSTRKKYLPQNTNNEDKSTEPNHSTIKDLNNTNDGICSSNKYSKIQCKVEHLLKDQEVSVLLPFIVWAKTIQKISPSKPVQIGSYVEINLTNNLFQAKPTITNTTFYSSEIITIVTASNTMKITPVIPLWIIVASVCSGVVILLLMILGLYKCGFFKRQLPPAALKQEPLKESAETEMSVVLQ